MMHKDVVSDSVLVRDYINGKELAIELLMRDDLVQAQQLLTWMDVNQDK